MEERILETVLTERRVPPSCSYKSARTELYGLLVVSSELSPLFFPLPFFVLHSFLAIRARIHSIARSRIPRIFVIRRNSPYFAEGKSQHRPKTRNDVLFYQSQSNFVTGKSKRGKFPRWRGHRLLPTSTLLPSIKHPDDDRNERC